MEEIFANPIIELEDYGYIYFCLPCCAEIGAFVSMIPREQMEILAVDRDSYKASFLNATNENTYLRGLLNARISLAGEYAESGEPDSNGSVSVSLLEVKPKSDEPDSDFDVIESVLSESGASN
jgi:hypothetical protein